MGRGQTIDGRVDRDGHRHVVALKERPEKRHGPTVVLREPVGDDAGGGVLEVHPELLLRLYAEKCNIFLNKLL